MEELYDTEASRCVRVCCRSHVGLFRRDRPEGRSCRGTRRRHQSVRPKCALHPGKSLGSGRLSMRPGPVRLWARWTMRGIHDAPMRLQAGHEVRAQSHPGPTGCVRRVRSDQMPEWGALGLRELPMRGWLSHRRRLSRSSASVLQAVCGRIFWLCSPRLRRREVRGRLLRRRHERHVAPQKFQCVAARHRGDALAARHDAARNLAPRWPSQIAKASLNTNLVWLR